jgi:phosphoribosylaminoimidazolecarboxamide formyltransferase/IMP cyclohydrolase
MSHSVEHLPPSSLAPDDVATRRPLRRALVSVYDKTGLAELADGLHSAGVELVSTGSTASTIAAAGIPVTRVEDLTGFPECLDGRVKTLHPRVHAPSTSPSSTSWGSRRSSSSS